MATGGERRRFEPRGPLLGELRVPGDKSISHRVALIAAVGDGVVEAVGFLDSADTRSTLAAAVALGAEVRDGESGVSLDLAAAGTPLAAKVEIVGVGLRGAAPAAIDVGNAGTLIRLLPGLLAGQPPGRSWRLDGDDSIRARPMGRIAEPLRLMGAEIECGEGDRAPIAIRSAALHGIEYELPIASAQVKSCLLLAGLLAEGPTEVREPEPSRDHTERLLAASGVPVTREGRTVTVESVERIEPPARLEVPGDISSAAFFMVAATLVPGSDIVLRGVGVNPTRTGVLDILTRMGADLEVVVEGEVGGEPVADIRVRAASSLRGVEIGGAEIPRAIDELPILALAAACAQGPTVVRDAAELRRKESDRIATVAAALRALGAGVEETEDGMEIAGSASTDPLRAGLIEARGDHRIAMLGAVAGLAVEGGVTVDGMNAAGVSYPAFEADLASLG